MDSPEMGTRSDVLDRPAGRAVVRRLQAAGLLSPEARDAALRWLQPPADWWGWSSRGLLFIGSALVLSGVVFFFAHNWARLGPFMKLGIVEAGLAGCLAGAFFVGLDRPGGKILLLSASFLVGVFLAVYGQIYQTGADAWELFAGWAALILGFTLISRFAALWVMELALADTALILYWEQVVMPNRSTNEALLFLLLGLLNASTLIFREVGILKGVDWLRGRWVRLLVWVSALFFLTAPVAMVIVEPEHAGAAGWAGTVALAAVLGGAYYFYRYRSPDLPALTLGAASLCTVILVLIGRLLFDNSNDALLFMFFGFIVVAVVGGAVLGLWRIGRSMEAIRG
jgi:uncharacterized membrane protein